MSPQKKMPPAKKNAKLPNKNRDGTRKEHTMDVDKRNTPTLDNG